MQEQTSRLARAAPKHTGARPLIPVLLLGLNVWVVCVLWPLLVTTDAQVWELAAGALTLLPLALGALWLRKAAPDDAAAHTRSAAAWLFVFPVAIGALLAAAPLATERALGPFGCVLGWLSLCGYGAAAASTCAPERLVILAQTAPLPRAGSAPPAPRRLRSVVLLLCFSGAAALVLIAPGPALDALEHGADDSVRAGVVLAEVIGAALGCSVVAVFLAAGLRAEAQPSEPRLDANLRAAWFLFLTLLGVVTYFVVN